MKVEVAVKRSPSLRVLMVSADIKQQLTVRRTEIRSCVKVEVAILGSPSLTVLMIICGNKATGNYTENRDQERFYTAQELCSPYS